VDSSINTFNGSPLVSIDGTGNFGLKRHYSLVNSETGELVYDDKDEDGKKSGETFLQKKMAMLTSFKEGKGGYIVYRSMVDGKEKWRKNFTAGEAKMKGLIGGIMSLAGVFVLSSEGRNDVNENLIISTATKIFYINGSTGEEIWSKTTDKNIISIARSNDDKYLFYQAGGKLNYCNVNTGADVLQSPIKENSGIISVKASSRGYIINTGHGSNIVTEEGNYKFKKNLCKKYSVYDMVQLEDGYIFTNYSDNPEIRRLAQLRREAMAKADNKPVPAPERDALFVSKYDFEGNKIWEKVFMEFEPKCYFLPKGIFITSNNLGAFYTKRRKNKI
jgi:outer membrane protein assembly factor BamB